MDNIRKMTKEEFPKALFEIPQPPEGLYIKGEMPSENLIYLCIVGSRKHTTYGKDVCEKLIDGLKGYPIVIVSGLATGIDSIAHVSAMKAGLKTISFPGSGLSSDVIFPRANIRLAEEIANGNGCLISEFEPDFKATMYSFPQRNRLMAGMSKAVLIIEAEEKSGTLITARLALDYNRDVLVVPGSIFSPNSKATNRLIREGALPISSVEDLLQALGFELPDNEEKQAKLFADCSPDEKIVFDILREPTSRDELIREMNMPTPKANAILSIMEIKEMIKDNFGEIRRN